MKNEFHHFWDQEFPDLDAVANAILTGRNLEQYKQSEPHILHLGVGYLPSFKATALDFGCGMGRLLVHGARLKPNWLFIGYDSEAMINRIKPCWGELPENVSTHTSWDNVFQYGLENPIHIVYADLVFQHMMLDVLRARLQDLRNILRKSRGQLIVHGRRNLDDRTNLWPLVAEFFNPVWLDGRPISYLFKGEVGEHATIVFDPKILM